MARLSTVILAAAASLTAASAIPPRDDTSADGNTSTGGGTCRKTKVAILGAGIAGVTTAQTLSNQNVTDFVIVEYQSDIGGRVHNHPFGKDANGKPLLIEYGANWAQGLGGVDGHPENPIWSLEKKWGIQSVRSNFERLITYDETGPVDFRDEVNEFYDVVDRLSAKAGEILVDNLQDRTIREGFRAVGWKPEQRKNPAHAEAVEWWLYDGEQALTPEETSLVFNQAVSNFTFLQFSDENEFIIDQRGHNTWIKGEASEFLQPNDERLLLNSIVKTIEYSSKGVRVTLENGDCIEADYAVCTFSLGVLQQDDAVAFEPALPEWKTSAIDMFEIGTYTKIFMQFPEKFWTDDTEFFLYADPFRRGWYPIFQSLDLPGFFPGSKAIFVTVTGDEAHRVEKMSDADVQREVMDVLRLMFPEKAATMPEPTSFLYPRWSTTPWAYGSFSCWPAGTTLEQHQNLRANVDRLWFAGEHTSATYFGYMQGAWYEGRDIGGRIAGLVKGECIGEAPTGGAIKGNGGCGEMVRYEVLHGTTEEDEYNVQNGWDESFQADGFDEEA
ncbi:flavin-containing amine oxidoreductase-domain containing protein [Microdochium trichocladiopsis]|uniref:Amine oxidase n=1 Tax=Microdochium trichocladiopsis TaxID=1682393 RepID=A0A9P8Y8Z2_9PEZI|nr:flavin-containing amine oxidoreductase-domain containing protein [Microdochium trichocladiopsis]KAH7032746.1 flavin-containing amine oxidoreductase-domain containing protein [Microdochium trichocladiopsis]